jgi:hypothetical protein
MPARNLTLREWAILENSPYDSMGKFWGERSQVAARLVKEGLLEENPTAPGFFRITQKGEAALEDFQQQWSKGRS